MLTSSHSPLTGGGSKITGGGLSYDFIYSKNDLVGVKKNNSLIEEHDVTDTETDSYYPSKTNSVYTQSLTMDKYGRLVTADGLITNTYGINPWYISNEYTYTQINEDNPDHRGTQLAVTTDHTDNSVTKYAYDENKLGRVAKFSSDGTKAGEEVVTYDSIDRPTEITYTYGGQTVRDNYTYETAEDAPDPDNRIDTYTFTRGSSALVSSVNNYDAYKRPSTKLLTVGSNTVTKINSYSGSVLSSVKHSKNGEFIHNYGIDLDGLMRLGWIDDYANGSGYTNYYAYDSYGPTSA